MAVISKEVFYERISQNVHCKELHLWEPDCRKATIFSPVLVYNVAKGTANFFLPIYLLKLVINYKKRKDKDFIKSLLMAEMTSIVYGVFLASSLISSICMFRKLFGRIHYYNLVLFPGIISGLALLVETKENQVLDTLIFFNAFIETILKNIHYSLFAVTKSRETLMFMMVSATLMYLLSNRKKPLDMIYFWFYTPPKLKDENVPSEEAKVYNHGIYSWEFWKNGFLKYFALGYAVNIVRRTLSNFAILTKKPQEIFKIFFSKSNVKFGLFIGGYVTTYNMLTSYLTKWGKIKSKFHGLIAGFLSGLTYAISPNIQVLVVGITTILQVLYSDVSDKLNIKNHFWLRQSLYMFCHGLLIHMKLCYPNSCSPYYKNMIDACTNNLIARIYGTLMLKYFPDKLKGKQVLTFNLGS